MSQTKFHSKGISAPIRTAKTIEALEENIGVNHWHWVWQWTPRQNTKAQATKESTGRLDLKNEKKNEKKNYPSKDKKLLQHTEWEKIFKNHLSDKGITSRIYKELL